LREYGIEGITVVPLKPKGRSKELRIRLFIAELYNGSYYLLDPSTRSAFIWQASLYKIGKPNNRDDLLDAVSYGLDVRNEYWHLLVSPLDMGQVLQGEARVVPNNAPF